MTGEQQKRWQDFCELAARERDPKRLIELVSEMNRLFAEEEGRKKQPQNASQSPKPIRTGTANKFPH